MLRSPPQKLPRVLFIGAMGRIGKVVLRRFIGVQIPVVALVRDLEKARHLAKNVELIKGSLTSIAHLDGALHGCNTVYLSVRAPRRASFRPETDGLRNVLTAARNHGKLRIILLSAIGASRPEAAKSSWWIMRQKAEAETILKQSSHAYTIFQASWFMETLPLLFRRGSFESLQPSRYAAWWIAASDYSEMVVNAIRQGLGIGEVILVQGKERYTVPEALSRFAQAYFNSKPILVVPHWQMLLRSFISPVAREWLDRHDFYETQPAEPAPDPEVWETYGNPQMTIASFAEYARRTGGFFPK